MAAVSFDVVFFVMGFLTELTSSSKVLYIFLKKIIFLFSRLIFLSGRQPLYSELSIIDTAVVSI